MKGKTGFVPLQTTINIAWCCHDTIEVIHSNNKLTYMLCHIGLLLGIYNVGEVGKRRLAVSGYMTIYTKIMRYKEQFNS